MTAAITIRDVIQEAFEQNGTYAPGEPMGAADALRGLSVLNQMMDSWSNENLTCFAILEQICTLVPGKYAYTIGPGGDVNGTRPLSLITTSGSAYILDPYGNQYPVEVITQARWNQRGSRNTNSNFPDVIFYDPQYPLGILNFDPIPNISYDAHFDSYLQISQFADIDTNLVLPPGYQLAIRSNLTVKLHTFYPNGPLDPGVIAEAAESKATVKRTNIRLNVAAYDPELVARSKGRYSIFTDTNRR